MDIIECTLCIEIGDGIVDGIEDRMHGYIHVHLYVYTIKYMYMHVVPVEEQDHP